MAVINNTLENDIMNISNLLNVVGIEKLYIISISIDDTFDYKVYETNEKCNVKLIEVSLKFFMCNFLDNPDNTNF
jgi:hypothetical protein